ncbi:site-2 protease family protein [Candidatus Woesearchaeota archaeon]|nr:site-2 protease family protein [Candidatus Woesearchaeota archaeon]
MDFNIILAIAFILFLIIFTIIKRKSVVLQKVLWPVVYVIMWKTGFGLKLMDRWGKKYKGLIQLLGQASIGLAFLGMAYISISILIVIFKMITAPESIQGGFALVLPFTNIPGVGYLPFTYWIIAIFVLAVVHEFSHGVMARAYDVPVQSSGFAIFSIIAPIIPAAFVEPDEKVLQKRDEVTQNSVFAAGPISNVALGFVFLLIMMFVFAPIEARITEPTGFIMTPNDPEMPAAKAGMPDKFLVTNFNGEETADANKFMEQMYYCTAPGDEITVGNKNQSFTFTAVPRPEDPNKGIIGVSTFENQRDVKPQYAMWKAPFYWFKGLFKWLFLLNLFIGLANLLPLGIVDGGRMLQIALKKIMKNEKHANKIWGMISFLFIGLIVLGLVLQYVGNPFG